MRVRLEIRKMRYTATPSRSRSGTGVNRRNNQEPAESPPSAFVLKWLSRVPRGSALDVAMGEGRHALHLATLGFHVLGVDRQAPAVARVRARAEAKGLPFEGRVLDLEARGLAPLVSGERSAGLAFALIVNVNYLQRDLLPALKDALAPGGWILFETFTTLHPRVSKAGRPSNPDFLLRPGELRAAFENLIIEEYTEGVFRTEAGDRKAVARLAAHRPAPDFTPARNRSSQPRATYSLLHLDESERGSS